MVICLHYDAEILSSTPPVVNFFTPEIYTKNLRKSSVKTSYKTSYKTSGGFSEVLYELEKFPPLILLLLENLGTNLVYFLNIEPHRIEGCVC